MVRSVASHDDSLSERREDDKECGPSDARPPFYDATTVYHFYLTPALTLSLAHSVVVHSAHEAAFVECASPSVNNVTFLVQEIILLPDEAALVQTQLAKAAASPKKQAAILASLWKGVTVRADAAALPKVVAKFSAAVSRTEVERGDVEEGDAASDDSEGGSGEEGACSESASETDGGGEGAAKPVQNTESASFASPLNRVHLVISDAAQQSECDATCDEPSPVGSPLPVPCCEWVAIAARLEAENQKLAQSLSSAHREILMLRSTVGEHAGALVELLRGVSSAPGMEDTATSTTLPGAREEGKQGCCVSV